MAPEGEVDAQLSFDREKWAEERGLRSRELDIRERELARSRWGNPLMLALFAAAIAGGVNAWVAWNGGNLQRELESQKHAEERRLEESKAESARILEVVKFRDPHDVVSGLQLLVDIGLISNPARATLIMTYTESATSTKSPPLSRPNTFIQSPRIQGNPIDICAGGFNGTNQQNDCSASGQRLAANQACIALGLKSAVNYSVAGLQGTALHWDGGKFQLLPTGAVFSSLECAS